MLYGGAAYAPPGRYVRRGNRFPERRISVYRQKPMTKLLSLGEAASALGVSVDTLRRWDRSGRIQTERDSRNRRLVPASEILRLSKRPPRHRTGSTQSARNRFAGVITSVESDGVMALVELEAGPFLVTAAITRDAIDELGLAPGVAATAVVKATSVMIEREAPR
jgi:molybdopterin-binding protein